jgi:hypothetical protein
MPLNLLLKPFADWNFLSWLWVLIGLVSVIFFIYLYKLSTKEGIELSEIEAPVLKDFFGRKQLSLKLKNGKARHLQIKSIKEMKELLQVIEHELQTSS